MINKKVILLAPFEYYFKNKLAKYLSSYFITTICADLYYYQPLKKVFSKVIPYNYPERIIEIGLKGINEEIIELVREERPDYLIWTAGSYEFRESTFDSIRKEGTIVIGFFYDDEYRFDDYSKWWIPHLDYCVTNSIEAVPKYREIGAKSILGIPIAGGIAVERDWSNLKERYDVSFVGDRTPVYRKKYLNELRKRAIPIHLFGGDRNGGYIPLKEMLNVYWFSKINLNFSRTGYKNEKLQMKGRIFEVPMAGGFLLTEYVPHIENYFQIDKEIVCFRDSKEMIDKIKYYLNHDEERRAIAKAGWERARANYTSFHTLSKVFEEIEEDIKKGSKKDNFCPLELKMPGRVRKNFSNHYFGWGLAFAMVGDKKLWKDALSLSLSYNPFNIMTWSCYLIAFSPSFIRPVLYGLYKILYKIARKSHIHKAMIKVFSWFQKMK